MNIDRCAKGLFPFALALLLFGQAIASARNVQFMNLSAATGMSSEFVQDVAQDGSGFIWFATQAGLNRFDGHEIRVYEHRSQDPRSISHNFVNALYVDRNGVLWVGTVRGLNTYDPETDDFNRDPMDGALADQRVRKILQDRGGRYWIGTLGGGLFSARAGGQDLVQYRHVAGQAQSLPGDRVIDLLEDRSGDLWVATESAGLARLDPAKKAFEVFAHVPGDASTLSGNRIRSIAEDRQGNLWVGTAESGLVRMLPTGEVVQNFASNAADSTSLTSGQVRAIFQDDLGTLWVGTDQGLSEWRPDADGFVRYTADPANQSSLVNNRVNRIIQDQSGVLWVVTHGGVSAWNYISDIFNHYSVSESFLQSDVVTSMSEASDGSVWVATFGGGVSQLDFSAGSARHYRHDPENPTSLSDDRVMSIHVDRNDTVWIGTRGSGLCRRDPGSGCQPLRHDPDNPNSISGNAVSKIVEARNGDLWVGVFGGGLNRLRWQDGQPQFHRFRHDPRDRHSLSSDRVLAIFEDAAGMIWVGTEGAGLNRLDPQSGRFDQIDIESYFAADGSNPVSGTPWELYEDARGNLWIGTLGQGLLRWAAADRASDRVRFEQYAGGEGLSPDIYAIVGGPMGELWLSSNSGLFRFNPRNGDVRRFDSSNGLRTNEFNQGARLRLGNGQILFGSTRGLVAFPPRMLRKNRRPPPLDLAARSRESFLARASSTKSAAIVLDYLDPFVSFEFSALDYVSPDKNQYRYRLAGHDTSWNESEGMRKAVYSSLPSGSYTFEVQAANSDGVWNRKAAAIQVRVKPAPWLSRWALSFYAGLLISLLIWARRRQKQRRLKDAEMKARLKRLVNERTAELADRTEELLRLNEKFREASVRDQLTGLRNRRFVDQYIETGLSSIQREHFSQRHPVSADHLEPQPKLLAVLMIDLDGFKLINDRFGHHAGDQALIGVRDRLLANSRKSDIVVRWGGDEFLILAHVTGFEDAKALAEKIRVALASPEYDLGPGSSGQLSGSIGVTAVPFASDKPTLGDWEQIIAIADRAAYVAKRSGRNAWVSIQGTQRLIAEEMHMDTGNLGQLVEQKKVSLDSSLSTPLETDAPASKVRATAV